MPNVQKKVTDAGDGIEESDNENDLDLLIDRTPSIHEVSSGS